ncbi:hypothetical protein [Halobacillus massiliensis]|uniref:hypothetical protein n=1 Tax=Halobacillus massiliensis TaxID=1926286 RepID=UPI0009E324A4|nr:hypothetical protein [Halobacillus massiliensis]
MANIAKKPTHKDINKYKSFHVTATMEDGTSFDGIITDINGDEITFLRGEDVTVDKQGNEAGGEERKYYPYGNGSWRSRRFTKVVVPLAALTTVSHYPYSTPYYPYFPYYPYY